MYVAHFTSTELQQLKVAQQAIHVQCTSTYSLTSYKKTQTVQPVTCTSTYTLYSLTSYMKRQFNDLHNVVQVHTALASYIVHKYTDSSTSYIVHVQVHCMHLYTQLDQSQVYTAQQFQLSVSIHSPTSFG